VVASIVTLQGRPSVTWRSRWPQLTFAVLCTIMLANLQYGWTMFVNPMHDANHWSRASIQVAFTIMIFVNTWLSPIEGWLVDRYGPRPVVMAGGLFAGVSWLANSEAKSLGVLYVSAVIGGLAIGCVFGTCMGTALKWFPDKRGLAAGLIAAGYGLGAGLTSAPLAIMIRASGYRYAFRYFAFVQGITILIFAALLIKPVKTAAPILPLKIIYQGAELGVAGVFRSRVFWLIYLIYLLIAFGGMVMTAQLGPIARDFGLETQVVTIMGISMPLLAMAVSIDNFTNGITRPISGFLSDFLGRENMMLLMFSLEAAALLGMVVFGRSPSGFLLFASLIFLFWGEIFVVFPAICGDCFGVENAAANNGLLYTAKGTSALAVPLASLVAGVTGTWSSFLLTASICSLAAGLLAKFVLVPMRRRLLGPVPYTKWVVSNETEPLAKRRVES
jgi:OFA family oxalate/formate antiporter-like MFS transporter